MATLCSAPISFVALLKADQERFSDLPLPKGKDTRPLLHKTSPPHLCLLALSISLYVRGLRRCPHSCDVRCSSVPAVHPQRHTQAPPNLRITCYCYCRLLCVPLCLLPPSPKHTDTHARAAAHLLRARPPARPFQLRAALRRCRHPWPSLPPGRRHRAWHGRPSPSPPPPPSSSPPPCGSFP